MRKQATLELERLCVAGYTPMEVITMATKVNARLLQMEDQLGTLETGKLADVLLVDGNRTRTSGSCAAVTMSSW